MVMEVGVATELVAGQGGRKKEEVGGGGHKTSGDTERVDVRQEKKKGRIACVCFVQSLCNNVQRAAAEMRPRWCRLAARSRSVYARTSSPRFLL